MTYYNNILERVRKKQQKSGVGYPERNGKLYNSFKFFYIASLIFTSIWSLLYILAILIFWEEGMARGDISAFITVTACTLIMLLSMIALKFNENLIVSGVFSGVNVAGSVILSLMFSSMQKASENGLQFNYYWRHLIPLVLVAVSAIGISVVVFWAYFGFKKNYNSLLEFVYSEYNALPDGEKPSWEEYVENYSFTNK